MKTETNREDEIAELRKMIEGIRIAMFTTIDADGMLHSRPLATQETEFDGTLWFFTQRSSPKVGELERNPNVNVAYADPDTHRYVSVSGRASMVDDSDKIKELWSSAHLLWFPKGIDDPELTLLQVNVEHAQYWSSPSSAVVTLLGLAALATGTKYEPGKNQKISLTSQ